MGNFTFNVPSLGNKFKDYRSSIAGDSFNWSWVRPMQEPRYLVIHHSAGPDTQTPQDIANYHVNVRGWGGIGYHFLIGRDGTTYYVGDLTTARANVLNMNELVIGICLIGNFTGGSEPTSDQINSAHELCSQLLFRTPELSSLNAWTDVVGHKQLNATECPGSDWDNWHNQIVNVAVINPGTNNSSRATDITNLYLTVLGRNPDASGLQNYIDSGETIDQIRKDLVESPEHQQILARANNFKNVQNLGADAQNLVAQAYWKINDITKIG